MTKNALLSRWHIIKKRLTSIGASAELDALTEHQITVLINTSQNISDVIEWGYTAWDDVRSCWQLHGDGLRYFGISFKKPKGWKPDEDGPEEEE